MPKIKVHSLDFECPNCHASVKVTFKHHDLKKKEIVALLTEVI